MKRTDYCGRIDRRYLSQTVTLMGWVHRRRDHGGVIFVDLRDREGLVQVVFNPDREATFRLAESLRAARELAGIAWEEAVDELYARYDSYHWVHAINNTALVAAALYAFDDDFSGAMLLIACTQW